VGPQEKGDSGPVATAVKHLLKAKQPVTFNAIRETVRSLFQVAISTNTIQRNPEAYATYLQHRTHRPRMQTRSAALRAVLNSVNDDRKESIRVRVNRLRRESKDTLIARLIQLETSVEQQIRRQDNLREEILRLSLGSRRKGKEE
jgi:hypothetical protein